MTDRARQQLAFLTAADGLKRVPRDTALMDGSRVETVGEQTWHTALWCLVFAGDEDLAELLSLALVRPLPMEAVELLPDDQKAAVTYRVAEAAAGTGPAAQALSRAALAQPLLQELASDSLSDADRDRLRASLATGALSALRSDWPFMHFHAEQLLTRTGSGVRSEFGRALRFLAEADRLKTVLRGTTLCDGSRRENSAEHSWHIALYALILAEHAIRPVDIGRVLQMLVLHDIVEIDAGDAPIHGGHDPALQAAKELAAADRLFGLLPRSQGAAMRALWTEFEAAESDDAIYAKAVDRLQPVMANLESGGGTWPEYDVTRDQLENRVGVKVRRGAPTLWDAVTPRLDAWFGARA